MAGAEDRADADLLRELARDAAALALTFFGHSPKSWTKDQESPVSEADIALDRLLHDRLRAARPDYGWLSEETADSAQRLSAQRLFVIDPIDGTRSFLEGRPDWTVSLAVVELGRPVAACLIAPVSGQTLWAARGWGAHGPQGQLAVSATETAAAAKVASAKAKVGFDLPPFGGVVPRIASLALRLASVATAELDAAFAGPGAKDWDIAAADLLVSEAGGRLSDFYGQDPIYNRPEPQHGPLLACGPKLHEILLTARAAALNHPVS